MGEHVLWNKPTIRASIDDTNKKFKSLNAKMKLKMNNRNTAMDKLPTIIQYTYEYDNTYEIKSDKVKQLSAHCFIYRCSE